MDEMQCGGASLRETRGFFSARPASEAVGPGSPLSGSRVPFVSHISRRTSVGVGVTRVPKTTPLGSTRSIRNEPRSSGGVHSSGSSVMFCLSHIVGMCV